MKRVISISLLTIACWVFYKPVSAQQGDSIKRLPPVNQERVKKIDVTHIAIDLKFDWVERRAYGTATITLMPLNNTNKIALDAGMLTINSVKLSTGKVLKFTYDGSDKDDAFVIELNRIYNSKEKIIIKIDYNTNWVNETDPNNLAGSNGKGIRFFEPTATELKRRKQIWSMGEPVSNRYWFPSYDAPNDLRTTEFKATVDKNLMAISNGKLIETKTNNDGTKTFHWKTDVPYPNYKTSFVVGEYVDVKQNYKDIQLHSFGYPDETDAVRASVERLPDMMKFFSEYTGVKYPYEGYSQVFVQEAPWGVGYNTISTHTENMVDDYRTHADYLYLWDGLEAEGLAQQWFGNYITIKDWSDSWLNRSFAHYFDCLYDEYKNGKDEFQLWYRLIGDYGTYFADWNAGNRRPVVTKNYEDVNVLANDNYSYIRGGMVLHMLRKYLGEDKWRKAIRHYVQSNANKTVTTADFLKAIKESTGEAMDWFFDQWLYKMGHPVFEVTKKYNEAKKLLTVTVKQTQQVDKNNEYPQVTFFQGKVEIEIDTTIHTIWLEDKEENVFTFNVGQNPGLVNFDYESAWIKEIKFEKPLEELLYQLQNDKDILGRRWALDELVNIAGDEKTSAIDKERVYEGLRIAALSNSYWRFRMAVLWQYQNLLTASAKTDPVKLDEATISMLLSVIKNNKSWVRTWGINVLGISKDPAYADLYISYLNDESERVVNAAAIALGKSKSPLAFDVLVKLKDKPSWKNQSLISTLYGLKELGDPRGFDIAFNALSDLTSPRWTLATPVWDFRIAAARTIASLGKSNEVYPMIAERFKKAIAINDINDAFSNVLLITTLGDPRGAEIFPILKEKYSTDTNAMVAVSNYETQFNNSINNLSKK